jgi:hypothetical protein
MDRIKAVYVDWHAPRKFRGSVSPVKTPWEIALIIRTTHFAKEANSWSPVLYCDEITYEYYKKIDLLKHFDEVKAILPLDMDSIGFDPNVFWAGAKFIAMTDCDSPFVMMDLDAEIRFRVELSEFDGFFTHYEGIIPGDIKFYPDPTYLDSGKFLETKHSFEWGDKALNTCIFHLKDFNLAKEYAESALEFMRNLDDINPAFEKVPYILLAEQRFIYEFCRAKGLNIGTLIKGEYVPTNYMHGVESFIDSDILEVGEKGFLHVWGYKGQLNGDSREADEFFGNLLSTAPHLKDPIVNSVSLNSEMVLDK